MTFGIPPTVGAALSDGFFWELAQMGLRRKTNPEHFLAVWCAESGLNPSAVNSIGARGLNQFLPSTLRALGAPAEFEKLSAQDQLPWIERYVVLGEKVNGGPFESAERYYHWNFLPLTMHRGNAFDAVVAAADASDPRERAAYAANTGLDTDRDGKITIQDLGSVLASARARFAGAFVRLAHALRALPLGQAPTANGQRNPSDRAVLVLAGVGALALVLWSRGRL